MLTICGIEFKMLVSGDMFYATHVSLSDTIEIMEKVQDTECWKVDVSTAHDGNGYFVTIRIEGRNRD